MVKGGGLILRDDFCWLCVLRDEFCDLGCRFFLGCAMIWRGCG